MSPGKTDNLNQLFYKDTIDYNKKNFQLGKDNLESASKAVARAFLKKIRNNDSVFDKTFMELREILSPLLDVDQLCERTKNGKRDQSDNQPLLISSI